jgi:hypothetical protein
MRKDYRLVVQVAIGQTEILYNYPRNRTKPKENREKLFSDFVASPLVGKHSERIKEGD